MNKQKKQIIKNWDIILKMFPRGYSQFSSFDWCNSTHNSSRRRWSLRRYNASAY